MVTIQETEMKERGLLAVNRAKELGRPILISEVHPIDTINPLSFFNIGKDRYCGERFFWKDPTNEIVLIGLGISKQIQSDQATDRFFHVEREWKSFLEDSIIFNPYSKLAVGPLMFGGFSFDPYKEKTDLWSKFADSLFHIPKYLLSVIDGETYLTTNIVITPNDDSSLFSKIVDERNQLLLSLKQNHGAKPAVLVETNEISPEEWKQTVDGVVTELTNGPLKKVVLARELRLFFTDKVEAEAVLENLYTQQPASYIFAFESNGDCFIGATPERLVKKRGSEVYSTCLAGSISRGASEEEDQILGQTLLNDQKNLIEHGFVVEMIKEALEESCEEIILPDKPQLLKNRDIQHLYTPVIGKCSKETSLLLLVERLHPTPALGGLPKKAAVEKIRQVEELDRGFYGAPLGWVDYKQNGEFAVSIRCGLLQGDEVSLFAGCGVVADSDSESEYLETSLKFTPMLRALGGK
ncbi:isochorismate synthase [Neobacillus sp. MM2021_6]|uniref:isochorismate synthase n=1 Tax=Bacillaceae TaxID=186817 RepID=UPI00140AFE95|nr:MULTISPECIES: isochorismate synthase [Bacillaceae]MBO0960280.1 isochorismate synthase [Neobacillus sp. MM2021_6]NHC17390.1 isochorismate synthase [Bacillus sp. MM2020_4]